MSFMGNFFDTAHTIQPQLNAVIAASMSIKNSKKVKKMLEIILAFGNYLNSSKRGAVYGFKLQSLDVVSMRYKFRCFTNVYSVSSNLYHLVFN